MWGVVEGSIPVRPGSKKMWKISGTWTEQMKAYNEETRQEIIIWKANEMPAASDWNYFFSHYGINLNHLPARLKAVLPPTDSRLRQDQMLMENGKGDEAL